MTGFRLQCKCFYGTWPQCEVTNQGCLDNAIRLLPPIDWAVVAREAHKDGTPHLHGIFYFKEKCDLKDANATLDLICMKHGNYQGAKSPKKVLRYVCKDGNYVTFGDVPDFKPKDNINNELAKVLLEGGTYADCVKINAGVSMLQKRKLEEFESWVMRKKQREDLEVWVPPADTEDYSVQLIVDWLRTNIKQPRSPRQTQLFVCGPPGVGKSRLIGQLSRFLRIYHLPKEENFYDEWENGCYDLAVLDEFKSHKKLQWLNNWLDGSVMCIPQKGKQTLKKDNIPTIILSNYTLEEMYKPSVGRDALIQRLICVQLVTEFNLFP